MPDIFLRPGEPNPNDVRLRDTTTPDGGGPQALDRTVADSIATLSETTNQVFGSARSAADSLAGSSGGGFPLLLGSSGASGISESVSSHKDLVRSAADSVSSLSETTSRTFAPVRIVADAISAISEAVVGVVSSHNVERTTSDSLAAGGGGFPLLLGGDSGVGISEAADRLLAAGRAVADAVGAISEAVVGIVTPSGPINYTRDVVDAIAAISESVSWPAALPQGRASRRWPFQPQGGPIHIEASAGEALEFLYDDATSAVTESDEWVVLDLPELVL